MSGGWGRMEEDVARKNERIFSDFFSSQRCEVEMGSCELLEKILSFSAFDVG